MAETRTADFLYLRVLGLQKCVNPRLTCHNPYSQFASGCQHELFATLAWPLLRLRVLEGDSKWDSEHESVSSGIYVLLISFD